MKTICLVLIVFCVVVIIVGIVKLHELPGRIARDRNHPQAEAISICSMMGLLIFPFWMMALMWAYMRPVMVPLDAEQRLASLGPAVTGADSGGEE